MNQQIKLYRIITGLTLTGIAWLLIEQLIPHSTETTLCLFKWVTGMPCPSCGTTSSLILILQGEFTRAFLLNPLGYLAGLALLVFPLWLLTDRLRRGASFFQAYVYAEHLLRKKIIFIPGIFLIALNWYWSIVKMI